MKYMMKYTDFLITEALHIHDVMDKFTDYVYGYMKGKGVGLYEAKNNKNFDIDIDINKVIFNVVNTENFIGELDASKSYNKGDGWVFYINLRVGFELSMIKHELDHALRLMKKPKEDYFNKLNYLKSKMAFVIDENIEFFFYAMYLASDEEINAMVKEAHGFVKEIMKNNNVDKLDKDNFINIIKKSRAYLKCRELLFFDINYCFDSYSKANINKFFYLYEENKKELDKINGYSLYIRNIRLIFKGLFSNKIAFDKEPTKIYKPDKKPKYYEDWIHSQGEKLRRNLFSLYEHYK